MKKINKWMIGLLVLAALLAAQFSPVLAAPAYQAGTPINGTVQSVTIETNATTGEVTVVVTVLDTATGTTQTVRISVDTAVSLGLVSIDPVSNQPVVTATAVGSTITIDPSQVLPEPAPVEEEAQHPVGSALADFFSEMLGVDYAMIMEAHEEGVGFGVIAQALWMTNKLEGDSEVFMAIIDARESGDYSSITMPDGSTPTNWGQFRKALLQGDRKANLGQIMSGHATIEEEGSTTSPSETKSHGNGNKKDKSHGNGNGNGNGH